MPRKTFSITDSSVEKLPVPVLPVGMERKAMGSAVRDYFDAKVTGFHVRISPSGRKTFALVYAMRDTGTRRRYTIGDYPDIGADAARALAKLRLAEAEGGVDPQLERKKRRVEAGYTVKALSVDFLTVRNVKASTRALYEQLLKNHLLPRFGIVPVTDVQTDDVARLHATMSKHKTMANQCVRLLHTMFKHAEKIGARPKGSNPASDVERYHESTPERYLQPHELAALIRALDAAESVGLPAPDKRRRKLTDDKPDNSAKHAPPPKPGKKNVTRGTPVKANPVAVAALRLLIATGARKSEVLSLKWADVDLSANVMILADSKTGRSVRPLSPIAVEILKAVPRVVGSPYVFTSPTNPTRPLADPSRLWDTVRHAAGLAKLRLHDLRHTAASVMLQSGATLAEVGRAIGHKSARTTQRYAAMNDAGAARAAALLGDALQKAATTPETPVTPLRRTSTA